MPRGDLQGHRDWQKVVMKGRVGDAGNALAVDLREEGGEEGRGAARGGRRGRGCAWREGKEGERPRRRWTGNGSVCHAVPDRRRAAGQRSRYAAAAGTRAAGAALNRDSRRYYVIGILVNIGGTKNDQILSYFANGGQYVGTPFIFLEL